MISAINYNVRFLFTALFVIINNTSKRYNHLVHHFFKTFHTKKTKLVLYWIILRAIPPGLAAIQVLPSDIRKYFSPYLIIAVAVVFISMFISVTDNCIFL